MSTRDVTSGVFQPKVSLIRAAETYPETDGVWFGGLQLHLQAYAKAACTLPEPPE